MNFKALPLLIAAAWLIPTSASAQLPPTKWATQPEKAKPDGCFPLAGAKVSYPNATHPEPVLWGAPKDNRKSGNWCGTGPGHFGSGNGSGSGMGGSGSGMGTSTGNLIRPKPSVAPWDHYSRDARDVKSSTTWEAPTRLDRKVAEEIEQTQIDYGPQDFKVAQVIWKHAQNYYNTNEYAKAKDLLRKLLDMADPEIRAKLPMTKVQKMYADSAIKMRPLTASSYKPFSHKSVSHFSTYQQYLNQPDVSKTQVGRGTFVYNSNSNTPLLSAANTQRSSNTGSVLVNGPNFSFRATGPTNIQLNGLNISIPAGASGTLNISNTPSRGGSGKIPRKTPVKYLGPGSSTFVPSSGPGPSTFAPTRGPGNFDTGGFHDLDPGFTIHNK